MQYYKELNMQLSIQKSDKPIYQNLHQLIAEGHRMPIQGVDGAAVGYVTSCTVHERPDEEERGKVGVSARFTLNKKLGGVVVDVMPLMIIYHFNRVEMFKLLSHFVIVVAPAFKTKS